MNGLGRTSNCAVEEGPAVRAVFGADPPEIRAPDLEPVDLDARLAIAARRHRAAAEYLGREVRVAGHLERVRQRPHAAAARVLDHQPDRLLGVLELGAHRGFEQARGGDLDAGNGPGDRGAERRFALLRLAADEGEQQARQRRPPQARTSLRVMVRLPVGWSAILAGCCSCRGTGLRRAAGCRRISARKAKDCREGPLGSLSSVGAQRYRVKRRSSRRAATRSARCRARAAPQEGRFPSLVKQKRRPLAGTACDV